MSQLFFDTSVRKQKKIWDAFCERLTIYECGVPLFHSLENQIVETKKIGIKNPRSILRRNVQMENMILKETDTLVADWQNQKNYFDGLIYMMFLKNAGDVLPLYIGKAETIGKGNRNLSANIKNLHGDFSKFARWGNNYAYHIGDLSAVVLPDHDPKQRKNKYNNWANALFVEFPIENPQLKTPVYFWSKAWKKTSIGIWEDFGFTRLTFLEYLMIGVASSVFPDLLLNQEGNNRG